LLLVQAYLRARAERREPDPQWARAWERFYAAYDPLIRRLAAAHPVPCADLEDRVQEIWRTVLTRLPRFRFVPQRGQLGGWLTTVARHVLAGLGRRGARHPLGHLSPGVVDRIPGREPEPALAGDLGQVRQWVLCALGELRPQISDAGYQVVYLRWIEGKRIAEVAVELGLATKQVREQHRRTIIKLRKLLTKRVEPGFWLAPDPARHPTTSTRIW
jgi:RNA polymerase sigma factor (sigma-70 family)